MLLEPPIFVKYPHGWQRRTPIGLYWKLLTPWLQGLCEATAPCTLWQIIGTSTCQH